MRLQSDDLKQHHTFLKRLRLIAATIRGASVSALGARALVSPVTEYVTEDEVANWVPLRDLVIVSPGAGTLNPKSYPKTPKPSLMQLSVFRSGAQDPKPELESPVEP